MLLMSFQGQTILIVRGGRGGEQKVNDILLVLPLAMINISGNRHL